MNGKQLKNSILQWAIQGKLVPQDPNDEPASVLLDRIRAEKARLVKEGKIKKDKNESVIFKGDDNSYYEKFADGKVVCIDDEIPFEIPAGWEWCRLGFLFQHNTGKALNGSNREGTLKEYITTSNLYWDKFELNSLRSMFFTESEIEKCTVSKGDLLVCEGGDIGRAAIWNSDASICIQNHIHRLRPYYDINVRYYYYIFLLYKGIGNIGGKGIGIQGLSSGALHNIIIPLPALSTQDTIVEQINMLTPLLERYERSETRLNELNAQVKERLKKSILQEAIQGKLVPQDSNDEPAQKLLEKINAEKQRLVKEGKLKAKDASSSTIFKGEDNKYYEQVGARMLDISDEIPFEIPPTWQWCRLQNIVSIRDAERRPVSKETRIHGKYPYYGANGILDYVNNYIFDGQFILVGEDGSVMTKYGNPIVNRADGKIWVNNHAHILEEYGKIGYFDYLFYALQAIDISSYVHGFMAKYSQGDLRRTLIPFPPYAEQLRIMQLLSSIEHSL